ncbi:MAG: TetR/AcrR family transcriptional regulator [Clostridiales bacterium]|nr:TetR/AcrR family transcriptional regulator [Clostridiales bacterium]
MAEDIKKSTKAEEKRNEIISAALDLFFSKGYEATTVRMIQNRVNQPVGLFYYYFQSKDQVFEAAMEVFFEKYEAKMQKIISDNSNGPYNKITKYINFIDYFTQSFRDKYSGKIHWSVLSSLWEYTIRIMRRYIMVILQGYSRIGLIYKTQADLEIVANIIAYSVGGSILYQNKQAFERQKPELFRNIAMLTTIPLDRL